jgi:hypothetical protein
MSVCGKLIFNCYGLRLHYSTVYQPINLQFLQLFGQHCCGGEALTPFAKEHFPHLNQSYAEMKIQTLVVAGDKDKSPLTIQGPEWFTDAFYSSPGANYLVVLSGGEHMLGGISGYLVTETTDEYPERVLAVQRLTWAYLNSLLSRESRLGNRLFVDR